MATSLTRFCPPPLGQKHHPQILLCSLKWRYQKPFLVERTCKPQASELQSQLSTAHLHRRESQDSIPSLLVINKCHVKGPVCSQTGLQSQQRFRISHFPQIIPFLNKQLDGMNPPSQPPGQQQGTLRHWKWLQGSKAAIYSGTKLEGRD